MKRHLIFSSALVFILLACAIPALAYEENISPFLADETAATDAAARETAARETMPLELLPPQDFYQAQVTQILEDGTDPLTADPYQIIQVTISDGNEKGQRSSEEGKTIRIEHGKIFVIREDQKVKTGDTVVLAKTGNAEQSAYFIYDKYRIAPVIFIAILFFALVVFFGRRKGLGAIIGLAVSLLILSLFIVPNILAGANPLFISVIGAFVIATVSLYLAHGFSKPTSIALISTLITLGIAAFLAILFVNLTGLSGAGTEEAFYLQFGPLEKLNLQGLLLGGIIIGALGVLDDITTGQTAAIHEIFKANPRLPFHELYRRGLTVGREHIASLVNTLVLAYAGASLPLFLIFYTDNILPLWVNLNSEFIVEEIVRTLVGSSALVFAVPISTALAAYAFSKKRLHNN